MPRLYNYTALSRRIESDDVIAIYTYEKVILGA